MGNKPRYLVLLFLGLVFLLAGLLVGCGPTALPVIADFVAAPSEINSGESVTLFWNVTGAASVSINQGIGDVSAMGMKVVSPMTTTAYTLSATNVIGTVTSSVLVTVIPIYQPSPPSPSFTTYRDERWGYTISYPDDWFVDTQESGMIALNPPSPLTSSNIIFIMAIESPGSASEMAQSFLTVEKEKYPVLTVLDNREMEGKWDWYLCYEYLKEFEYVTVGRRAEVYIKNTEQYMYVVNVDFEDEYYDSYPLSQIVDTFTLLP